MFLAAVITPALLKATDLRKDSVGGAFIAILLLWSLCSPPTRLANLPVLALAGRNKKFVVAELGVQEARSCEGTLQLHDSIAGRTE